MTKNVGIHLILVSCL